MIIKNATMVQTIIQMLIIKNKFTYLYKLWHPLLLKNSSHPITDFSYSKEWHTETDIVAWLWSLYKRS